MHTALENLMHGLTLDQSWLDDQTGSVSECGAWHGLILGPLNREMIPAELVAEWDELDDETRAELGTMAGATVSVDNDGAIEVEVYADERAMRTNWAALEASCQYGEDD